MQKPKAKRQKGTTTAQIPSSKTDKKITRGGKRASTIAFPRRKRSRGNLAREAGYPKEAICRNEGRRNKTRPNSDS